MQVNLNLPLGRLPFRTLVGDLLPSSSSHSHAGLSMTAVMTRRAWHVLASKAKVSICFCQPLGLADIYDNTLHQGKAMTFEHTHLMTLSTLQTSKSSVLLAELISLHE